MCRYYFEWRPIECTFFFLFIIIDRSKIQCIKVCSNLYLRTKGVTKSKAECGLWRASKTYNIYIFLLLCFSYLFLECFFFICLILYNSFFLKFFRYLLDIPFSLLGFLTIFQYLIFSLLILNFDNSFLILLLWFWP